MIENKLIIHNQSKSKFLYYQHLFRYAQKLFYVIKPSRTQILFYKLPKTKIDRILQYILIVSFNNTYVNFTNICISFGNHFNHNSSGY